MRKDRRFRPEIKPAVLVIQFCLVSAGVFAQQVPEQYLTPAIVENFVANSESILSAFEDLENHQDPKVQRQYAEYMEQVETFSDGLSSFMYWIIYGMEENYDMAKAYRKVLQIHVPPAIKAVYLEGGLGEQGHQVFMCLFLGIMLIVAKQFMADNDHAANEEARKLLAVMETLIHPQDLALIEEYLEELQEL